jgi:hypothetical protein
MKFDFDPRAVVALVTLFCFAAGFAACSAAEKNVERKAIILACEDIAPLAERILAARDAGGE